MYGERKHQKIGDFKTYQTRRELQKLQRRRYERTLLFLVILGPVMLYVSYQIGRSLILLREVKDFSATIEQSSPAEVKASLRQFAPALSDTNPFMRDAAMTAFKIATGWNLGTDPAEWERYWREQEPYWEYHRTPAHTNTPPPADWRNQVAPATPPATNPAPSTSAPATP